MKKRKSLKTQPSLWLASAIGLLLIGSHMNASAAVSDPSLVIDGQGRLVYRDPKPSVFAGTTVNRGVLKATPQSDPGDVFVLHSRPNSKKTIYLNFKGGTLTLPGSRVYNYPAFDLDGNPGSFSVAEKSMILEIFQRVSEDFATFDVDVTTEAPPRDRLARSNSADDVYGQPIFITRDVYNENIGGMAAPGSFDSLDNLSDPNTSDYYKAAFAYYDNLTPPNPDDRAAIIADAVSHELGHTVGLTHMGEALPNGTVYEYASGDWMTGWVPLMGNNGFARKLTTWTKGDYENSNNHEDELAIMRTHGLAVIDDGYGHTMNSATALANGVVKDGMATSTQSGTISTPDGADYFKVTIPAGPLNVKVDPAAVGPNLDVKLAVYDSTGKLLQSVKDKPTRDDALGASINLPQVSGDTYVIKVQGTGRGSPVSTDPDMGRAWGYTSYGSLGRYTLTAQYLAPRTESSIRLDMQYKIAGRLEADGYHAPVALILWPNYYGYYPAALADHTPALNAISDFGNGFVKTASAQWTVDPRLGFAQSLYLASYQVTYDKPGIYTVTALGVDELGNSASQTKVLTVLPPLPPTLKQFRVQVDGGPMLYNPDAVTATRTEYGFTGITINVENVSGITFENVVPGYDNPTTTIECVGFTGPITSPNLHCNYTKPGDSTITIKVMQPGIDGATVYTIPVHIL